MLPNTLVNVLPNFFLFAQFHWLIHARKSAISSWDDLMHIFISDGKRI